MTKLEALSAMEEGKRVTHRYFSDDEYIHMVNNKIMTEDNCNFTKEFEERRNQDPWLDSWELWTGVKCAKCLKVLPKDDMIYIYEYDEHFCNNCLPLDKPLK